MTFRLRALYIVRLIAPLAVAAVWIAPAWAVNDVLTQWTFETSVPATAGPHTAELGTFLGAATGSHAGATVYSNPAGNGSNESFSSTVWAIGDYYQFQTDTTGLTDIGVQFDHVSSTTGPRDFKLQYSTDGASFTDFGNYSVAPNNAPPWASAGAVQPIGMDTYSFNLKDVNVLEGDSSIFFRLTQRTNTSANGITTVPTGGTSRVDNFTIFSAFDSAQSPIIQPPPAPVLPLAGDIVMGSSADRSKTTLPLLRGPAAGPGAPPTPYSLWQSDPFIQSVDFDNTGGTLHNVKGNLLGVNFGNANTGNSGQIYSFATQGSTPAPAGQKIGDTLGLGGAGLTTSRLGGLSVSPGNDKIAVTGFEGGAVIVYDYTAGNTMGSGASLSGARQAAATVTTAVTQGTTWLDNNTVLTLKSTGELLKVDATTMAVTPAGGPNLGPPSVGASTFTSLYYNTAVSPYIWAATSAFNTTGETDVFALNATTFAIEDQAAYVTPNQSREIAVDAAGNLFFSANGANILVIQGASAAVATDTLATLTPTQWYQQPLFLNSPNFSGLDVGLASATIPGDFDGNGKVDSADYVFWRENLSMGVDAQAKYNEWKGNFGFGGPGSGSSVGGAAAVPEPASVILLVIGLAPLCLRRR
jgi:hypothetical protein